MDAAKNPKIARTSSTRGSRLRWLLLAVALLPCGWSALQRAVGSEAAVAEPAPQRPGLVFHQLMVDLGKVPPRPVVGARFRFTNRGERPVEITELKPSCGCLKPRLAKRVFQPGEVGEIILPVQTPNQQPGEQEYRVHVHYTDPEPNQKTLTFRVTLPEQQVTVRPRALIVYQFGDGDTTRELDVVDAPKLGLKLTGATCDLEAVTVQLGASSTDEFGNPQHTVAVTVPGSLPFGRHRGVVSITTDHPRYPVIRVPMIVSKMKNLPPRTSGKLRRQRG